MACLSRVALLWIIFCSIESGESFRSFNKWFSRINFKQLVLSPHHSSSHSPSPPSSSSSLSQKFSLQSSEGKSKKPVIHPSATDQARTITSICSGGTFCTSSTISGMEGFPYGSYVDYVLDEKGWPILLLNDQSMHTQNVLKNPNVSLFIQLPKSVTTATETIADTNAALSRVTIMGKIETIPPEELNALKFAFTLIHSYAEQIVDSSKFHLYRIKPEKIYFSGGFGVMSTWLNIKEYEQAKPDVLAQDMSNVLIKLNKDKKSELLLMCKHFLGGLDNVEYVRIQTIDKLGVDLRVKRGDFTDEYRIGFRHPVSSSEDGKSELMKLFQEAWERENGSSIFNDLPPIQKYAEDILRR